MSDEDKAVFTLAEVKIFKYLALIMGAIMAGICILSPEPAGQFLAVGLVVVMVAAVMLAIYLLRKRKTGK
jgi:hypothetical protein